MDYKKVIEDFNNGTIDRNKFKLIMDNDGGFWICIDGSLNEDEREGKADQMSQKYGDPCGYHDIVDVLNAAGVNTEWC